MELRYIGRRVRLSEDESEERQREAGAARVRPEQPEEHGAIQPIPVGSPSSESDSVFEDLNSEPQIILEEMQSAEPQAISTAPLNADPLPIPLLMSLRNFSRNGLENLITFFGSIVYMTALHWLLLSATIVAYFLGTVVHWWRVIRVDREVLLHNMDYTEEIDSLLLNSTIAMTRGQVLFWECFIDSQTDYGNFFRSYLSVVHIQVNDTYTYVRPKCHKILTGFDVLGKINYPNVSGFLEMQMFLCPLILIITILTVPIQAIFMSWDPADSDTGRIPYLMLNISTRIVNIVFSLIVIVISVVLDRFFQLTDPAFPISWPEVVRNATEIQTWQTGACDWLAGLFLQLLVLLLDFRRLHLHGYI